MNDSTTKIVDFYRGEIPNNEGLFFNEFLERYGMQQMEVDHAWIQWVLPTKQLSNFNDAPLLTDDEITLFKNDPELKEKLERVIVKVLDYFGMEKSSGRVEWIEREHARWWLQEFNHNMLRMDRFIVSLRYFGYDDIARQVFRLLGEYKNEYRNSYQNYWRISALADLP
jgi:hypothetical protein